MPPGKIRRRIIGPAPLPGSNVIKQEKINRFEISLKRRIDGVILVDATELGHRRVLRMCNEVSPFLVVRFREFVHRFKDRVGKPERFESIFGKQIHPPTRPDLFVDQFLQRRIRHGVSYFSIAFFRISGGIFSMA